ncbi:S41 family peptidase [Sphingomonas citri]|nr:S41 family peptidase [Sphingomonas citri]
MKFRPVAFLASVLFAALAARTPAQTTTLGASRVASSPLDAASRTAIATRLAAELRSRYVYPDVGERGAAAITAAAASGAYDRIVDMPAFTTRLTADLRRVMDDAHLVVFDSTSRPPFPVETGLPGEAGIVRADRLTGGIGYLEMFGFSNPWAFKPALDRAMAGLKGSRALILDVRGNGGGDPAAVSYLVSYFLPASKRIEVSSIVARKKGTASVRRKSFFSEPTPTSFAGTPTYILTSGHTFSGGEELAYDMKTLKLGTVVGEVTGGGANPGEQITVGEGVTAFIPTGRQESPITRSNWEKRGVQPDLKATAADALAVTMRRLGQTPAPATVEAASPVSVFSRRTMPLVGSEAMLRRLLANLNAPEPDYTLLPSDIPDAGREALAETHRRLKPLGTPKAIRFRKPDAFGNDVFELIYPDRSFVVAITLDRAGNFIGLIGPDRVAT